MSIFFKWRCKYPLKCTPYLDYTKINANDQLDLKGSCLTGCNENDTLEFNYNLYMFNSSIKQWKQFFQNNFYYLTGKAKSGLTIKKNLFQEYFEQKIWKIELFLNVTNRQSVFAFTSLIIYVNQPPKSGYCDIDPKNGTTSTLFNLICSGWIDTDGSLANYAFYGNIYNNYCIFFTNH